MTKNETEKQTKQEAQKQKEQFLMLPSVDFCFQELMEDKEILRGFCGAILRVMPEEIEDIILLPKQLRKKYKDEKYGILDVHILELPKLAKYEYPQTELLRWAKFFGAKSREEIRMLAEQDKYIDKAYRRLEEMSADEQKRWEYEMRQKAIRDQRHMLASGRREGLREGEKIGEERGRREGELQGKLEMARKMLKDKIPIEKVIEYSGLSVEEIQKLI